MLKVTRSFRTLHLEFSIEIDLITYYLFITPYSVLCTLYFALIISSPPDSALTVCTRFPKRRL